MSIGEFATGEASLAEQPSGSSTKKPPAARRIVAKTDNVAPPEPR